jgi:sugar phosphate isomerase/epimerase
VVANPGAIPAADDAGQQHFFDSLERLGREAARLGVRLALHLQGEGPRALAELLGRINSPGLAANYDPALAFAHRHDPAAGIAALAPHLAGFQVRDVVRAGTGLSGCTEVPLGAGVLDYPALVAAATAAEYRGDWTILPRGPGTEAADDIAWLRRLFR